MLHVSTSWNFRQHLNAKDMLKEIKQLGVRSVELNFNLTESIAKEFSLLRKKGEVDIVSLHNYCPIADDIDPRKSSPDNPSLSSLDEIERKLAVEQTKHTIEFANMVKAKAVILHIGKVGVRDKTIRLSRIDKENPLYLEMKIKMKKERETASKPYLERAIRSLEGLEPYARKMGVDLGIENRYYYREIPSIEEMVCVLEHFGQSTSIYYWHDVGHAQTQENLNFVKHEDYLKKFSSRLIGIHLHDIIGIEDHKVPGSGEFDFKRLLPYVKKDVHKIIETHQPATVEEMAGGLRFLEHIFKGNED